MKKNQNDLCPNPPQPKGQKILIFLLIVLLGLLLIALFFVSSRRYFDEDELEAIHTTWKMNQGEEIYVDFFQHHNPFFYYVLKPLLRNLSQNSNSLLLLRKIHTLVPLGIILCTFWIGALLFNRRVGLSAAIILAASQTFLNDAIELRPDVLQAFFNILAALFLFVYLIKRVANPTIKYQKFFLILSAVALAISFLFLQKAIIFILFLGMILMERVLRKKIPWYDLLIYAFFFLLTLAPYAIFLYLKNQLFLYYILNWKLNAHFLNTFSPWTTLQDIFRQDAFLLIMFGLALFAFFFKRKQERLYPMLIISCGTFIYLFVTPSPYPQYLLMGLPFSAIVIAKIFGELPHNAKIDQDSQAENLVANPHLKKSSLSSFYFLLTLYVVLSLASSSKIIFDRELTQSLQLNKIDFVLSRTQTNDYVYDADVSFNVFRKDLDYFWFSVKPYRALDTYRQTVGPYNYDPYQLIDRYKPKVISRETISNIEEPRIKDFYTQSVYHDLFIRNGGN